MCDVIYVNKHYRENIFSHNSAVLREITPFLFYMVGRLILGLIAKTASNNPYLTGKQYPQSKGLLAIIGGVQFEARASPLLIRSSGSITFDSVLGHHNFRLVRDSGPITCAGFVGRTLRCGLRPIVCSFELAKAPTSAHWSTKADWPPNKNRSTCLPLLNSLTSFLLYRCSPQVSRRRLLHRFVVPVLLLLKVHLSLRQNNHLKPTKVIPTVKPSKLTSLMIC